MPTDADAPELSPEEKAALIRYCDGMHDAILRAIDERMAAERSAEHPLGELEARTIMAVAGAVVTFACKSGMDPDAVVEIMTFMFSTERARAIMASRAAD